MRFQIRGKVCISGNTQVHKKEKFKKQKTGQKNKILKFKLLFSQTNPESASVVKFTIFLFVSGKSTFFLNFSESPKYVLTGNGRCGTNWSDENWIFDNSMRTAAGFGTTMDRYMRVATRAECQTECTNRDSCSYYTFFGTQCYLWKGSTCTLSTAIFESYKRTLGSNLYLPVFFYYCVVNFDSGQRFRTEIPEFFVVIITFFVRTISQYLF